MILQKYDFSSKSQLMYIVISFLSAVCDTAKVRFFKQITTTIKIKLSFICCLWYCKSTIFQANHNKKDIQNFIKRAVCDTAKVRFFKQITTTINKWTGEPLLFVILQKYDFSSKSQLLCNMIVKGLSCLWYCKSTIFQANHNRVW